MLHFFEQAARNVNRWGILVFIILLGALELLPGLFRGMWSANERMLDIVCLILPRFIFGPLLALFSLKILPVLAPGLRNAFAWIPFGWALLIIIITVDLSQYWYHRLHHQVPILWRFHRTHHTAPYMSVLVNSRQNIFYITFLSQFYITAALAYAGLGLPALVYGAFQTLWSYAYHSSVRWDKPLYAIKWLHPVAWTLEHLLVMPATHHAHHATTHDDGVGYYRGNFGGIFFIWDLLFGTALISRRYPETYGLASYRQEEWWAQIAWPFLKSKKAGSEISLNGPVVDETAEIQGEIRLVKIRSKS